MAYSRKCKRRLLDLANMLEFDPLVQQHFDMSDWLDTRDPNLIPTWPADAKDLDVNACGTTACALGWVAITYPKVANRHRDWREFAADVFGIDQNGADQLHDNVFTAVEYMRKKPVEIAEIIRKFVYDNMRDV